MEQQKHEKEKLESERLQHKKKVQELTDKLKTSDISEVKRQFGLRRLCGPMLAETVTSAPNHHYKSLISQE